MKREDELAKAAIEKAAREAIKTFLSFECLIIWWNDMNGYW